LLEAQFPFGPQPVQDPPEQTHFPVTQQCWLSEQQQALAAGQHPACPPVMTQQVSPLPQGFPEQGFPCLSTEFSILIGTKVAKVIAKMAKVTKRTFIVQKKKENL